MKRILLYWFFLFCAVLLANTSYAQDNSKLPSSTIYFLGTAPYNIEIELPNQDKLYLNKGMRIDYKIYSSGAFLVGINEVRPDGRIGKSYQIPLNIERGRDYFIRYSSGKVMYLEVAETDGRVRMQNFSLEMITRKEENINSPINKESLDGILKKGNSGQGTCFLISSDGYFITNFHCIENATEITITGIDGDYTTKYGATVIATDPSNDLALLKINNKNVKFSNPPFAIRSYGVGQAEKVYALGFPHASAMGNEMKITEGIISAKSGVQGDVSKFQISAAVNPGNSGGPLIDEKGNLIGVIYAKSTVAESAGYAIKASYLEVFLKNVDGFTYPTLINTIENNTTPEKVAELKNFIFILETK